ncbi:MAG: hypothetical protein KAG91_02345 [Mycoplasmataceae bacterium]|nr:hypothetical protein [Mycoplasmataceae bacterium]
MGFFNRKTTNKNNIQKMLGDQSYTVMSTHDSRVYINFEVLSYETFDESDEMNFNGRVVYGVDTDYGGGSDNGVETTFKVNKGKLSVDLDSINWDNVLDFTTIDEGSDAEYGDGELDSEDDWED